MRVGDKEDRYLATYMGYGCYGTPSASYSTRTLTIEDCGTLRRLEGQIKSQSGNTDKHGPNYDLTAVAEDVEARLKNGTADFDKALELLRAGGVDARETAEDASFNCKAHKERG